MQDCVLDPEFRPTASGVKFYRDPCARCILVALLPIKVLSLLGDVEI